MPASAAPKPRLPISFTTQPGSVSPSSSATFAWTTVAGASYTCSLDGAVATTCNTGTVTYTGLADASHTFLVRGKKMSTNRPGTASATWIVDTVPPGAPAIAPVATPTSNTSAVVSFTNSDQSAVAHTCALDANAPVTCQSPWTVVPSPLAEGSHTVTVRSRDAFGTLGGSSSVTWVVDSTAPAAVVLTGPSSPTNNPLATFSFSSTGATSYTCALDGAAAVACASGYSTTVAEGPHTMVVTGFDAASNASLPGTATWTLDTIAPPVPSILTGPASTTNQSGVDFVVDNPDSSATLQCLLDSGTWTACPAPLHYSVGTQGAHTLQVRAVDAAGNASAATAAFGWTLDTSAPAPAQIILGPASPTNQTTADFDFVPSDPADPGFNGFVCSVDSGAYVACDTDTVPLTTPVAEGSHTLSVKTVDTASNQSAPATWTWVVDLTNPTTPAFGTVPADPTSSTNATFSFSGDAGVTFTCTLDSGTAVPCASPYTVTGLSAGSHTLVVVASDAAGNTSQASRTWEVDTTAPAAPSFTSGPPTVTNQTAVDFGVDNPDATATLECRLDGGAWGTCPSPLHFVVLGDGVHGLEIRTADTAGNRSAAVGPSSWTLDTTAPAAPSFTSGPSGTTTATSASFAFSSADATAFTCTLDGAAAAACSSPFVLGTVAEGAHTLVVTAADAAGNTSQASRSWTVTAPTAGGDPNPPTPPAPPAGGGGTPSGPAATASFATSTALTGTSRVTFSDDVTGVSATTVTLKAGTVSVPTVLGCLTAAGAATPCTGAARAVTVRPAGHLVPGQTYTLAVSGVTGSNGKAVSGSTSFRASTAEQETSAAAASVWGKVKAPRAYGRSYVATDGKGATASYRFTGTSVTWFTVTGPTMGRATLYVDGAKKAALNNWSAAPAFRVARTVKGLKAGSHVLKVVVAGRAGHAGGGKAVAVDAVRVGKKKVVVTPAVTATWGLAAATKASGRRYAVDHAAGASTTFTFRGTSVTWVTELGPTMGKAKILVDGKLRTTVDNYAARTKWGVKRTLAGLTDGVHTVTVVVTGTKRAKAKGTSVVVDRWLVG